MQEKEFKKGDLVWIVYHHEVVRAKINAVHKEFDEIELENYDDKEDALWVGIIKKPWACFETKEEAEKYQKEMMRW